MPAGSTRRISATAYQALRSALSLVFWYKPTLERYLRAALRDQPGLLGGIDFGAKKRQVADDVVDRLLEGEVDYQALTIQLMIELANMTHFPELESHEDADKWLPKARAAVAELKRHTQEYENIISDRTKIAAELAANRAQDDLQRRFADELYRLHQQFLGMFSMTDPHARGRRFEDFLNSLFAHFDLDPRLSYSLATEQIDGAFSFDTDDYILEAKWTKNPVSREQADAFNMKVRRKGKNALGLIVSINGLTADARQAYHEGTSFMTMDGQDLMLVLEQRAKLDDALRRKKRYANETGACHFPVIEM